jgi:hypothetical protein
MTAGYSLRLCASLPLPIIPLTVGRHSCGGLRQAYPGWERDRKQRVNGKLVPAPRPSALKRALTWENLVLRPPSAASPAPRFAC